MPWRELWSLVSISVRLDPVLLTSLQSHGVFVISDLTCVCPTGDLPSRAAWSPEISEIPGTTQVPELPVLFRNVPAAPQSVCTDPRIECVREEPTTLNRPDASRVRVESYFRLNTPVLEL
jgi:hypothetical protein